MLLCYGISILVPSVRILTQQKEKKTAKQKKLQPNTVLCSTCLLCMMCDLFVLECLSTEH